VIPGCRGNRGDIRSALLPGHQCSYIRQDKRPFVRNGLGAGRQKAYNCMVLRSKMINMTWRWP
jgi:hypothetical protein